jgi:hypothetical protein
VQQHAPPVPAATRPTTTQSARRHAAASTWRRGRVWRHRIAIHAAEASALFQVALHDRGHVEAAVGRHGACERHDATGTGW